MTHFKAVWPHHVCAYITYVDLKQGYKSSPNTESACCALLRVQWRKKGKQYVYNLSVEYSFVRSKFKVAQNVFIFFLARADWIGIYPRDNCRTCVIADLVGSKC